MRNEYILWLISYVIWAKWVFVFQFTYYQSIKGGNARKCMCRAQSDYILMLEKWRLHYFLSILISYSRFVVYLTCEILYNVFRVLWSHKTETYCTTSYYPRKCKDQALYLLEFLYLIIDTMFLIILFSIMKFSKLSFF